VSGLYLRVKVEVLAFPVVAFGQEQYRVSNSLDTTDLITIPLTMKPEMYTEFATPVTILGTPLTIHTRISDT
jgi:hypothetical protein